MCDGYVTTTSSELCIAIGLQLQWPRTLQGSPQGISVAFQGFAGSSAGVRRQSVSGHGCHSSVTESPYGRLCAFRGKYGRWEQVANAKVPPLTKVAILVVVLSFVVVVAAFFRTTPPSSSPPHTTLFPPPQVTPRPKSLPPLYLTVPVDHITHTKLFDTQLLYGQSTDRHQKWARPATYLSQLHSWAQRIEPQAPLVPFQRDSCSC